MMATHQLGNSSAVDCSRVRHIDARHILQISLTALLMIEDATYQVVIQVGLALETLVRLLDSIISDNVAFLDREMREVEFRVTV
jgi:hypothetical protein